MVRTVFTRIRGKANISLHIVEEANNGRSGESNKEAANTQRLQMRTVNNGIIPSTTDAGVPAGIFESGMRLAVTEIFDFIEAGRCCWRGRQQRWKWLERQ